MCENVVKRMCLYLMPKFVAILKIDYFNVRKYHSNNIKNILIGVKNA